jgi:hypothetical protein
MYKHSLVSDFYLSRHNSQPEPETKASLFDGTLALAAKQYRDKRFVICRSTSKTWWETAWQHKK